MINAAIAALLVLPCSAQFRAMRPGGPMSGSANLRNVTTLRGVVTVGGKPESGATVHLQDPHTGMAVASAMTNSDGSFVIENLEPGTYTITTDAGLRESQDEINVTEMQSEVEVRFPSDAPATSSPVVSAAQLRVPDKAKHALEDARKAATKNDMAKATRKVAEALKIAPNFAAALTMRAAMSLAGGNKAAAVQDLDSAIHADASFPDAYFVMGATYNAMEQYGNAEKTLQEGLRLDPVSWQGHFELSRSLLGLGKAPEALKEIDAAIKAAPPNFAEMHLVRASVLMQMQRYDETATELETYLHAQPDGPSAQRARQVLAGLRQKQASGGGAQ